MPDLSPDLGNIQQNGYFKSQFFYPMFPIAFIHAKTPFTNVLKNGTFSIAYEKLL